jgi:hypothetical protein
MGCEFFQGGARACCRAVEGTIVPSHYERERFCLRDDPSACPTLRLYRMRQMPVTQEAYWAEWMPDLHAGSTA